MPAIHGAGVDRGIRLVDTQFSQIAIYVPTFSLEASSSIWASSLTHRPASVWMPALREWLVEDFQHHPPFSYLRTILQRR